MKQISPHIYVETQYLGSNVGCINTANGKVIVDCPVLPNEIADFKKRLTDINDRDVAYSIITDHHYDHSYATHLFCKHVISHKAAYKGMKFLQNKDNLLKLIQHDLPAEFDKDNAFFKHVEVGLPELTFPKELSLHMGDCTLELRHLGGHSAATMSIYVPEDKVIFLGDNFENQHYPFTREARYATLIEALRTIESSEAEILVPGHGEVSTKEPLIQLRSFFEIMRDQVKEHQQMIKEEGGIEKITTKVVEALSKHEVYSWSMPPRMDRYHQISQDVARMCNQINEGLL
jgi:cyclase